MNKTITDILLLLNFHQAAVISLGVFLTDFLTGVTAAIRSGRHLKSSIMHQTLSKKVTNYFHFFIIGLAFYLASIVGENTPQLNTIASIIVIIPAIPELLSLWENFKIIKTKVDTKPKE